MSLQAVAAQLHPCAHDNPLLLRSRHCRRESSFQVLLSGPAAFCCSFSQAGSVVSPGWGRLSCLSFVDHPWPLLPPSARSPLTLPSPCTCSLYTLRRSLTHPDCFFHFGGRAGRAPMADSGSAELRKHQPHVHVNTRSIEAVLAPIAEQVRRGGAVRGGLGGAARAVHAWRVRHGVLASWAGVAAAREAPPRAGDCFCCCCFCFVFVLVLFSPCCCCCCCCCWWWWCCCCFFVVAVSLRHHCVLTSNVDVLLALGTQLTEQEERKKRKEKKKKRKQKRREIQ